MRTRTTYAARARRVTAPPTGDTTMTSTTTIEIDAINSASVRSYCAQRGIASATVLSDRGAGDARVLVLELAGIEVAITNGDPVWREECSAEDWAALVAE